MKKEIVSKTHSQTYPDTKPSFKRFVIFSHVPANQAMKQFSRTLRASKKTMISDKSMQQCSSPVAGKRWRSLSASSYLILLLCCSATLVQAQQSSGDSNSPSLPHTAALASPGAGAGSSGGSSILDQFSPNCTSVSHVFLSRGIEQSELPQKPNNGE